MGQKYSKPQQRCKPTKSHDNQAQESNEEEDHIYHAYDVD